MQFIPDTSVQTGLTTTTTLTDITSITSPSILISQSYGDNSGFYSSSIGTITLFTSGVNAFLIDGAQNMTVNSTLNISGISKLNTTIINNSHTCLSSVNISGSTTLNSNLNVIGNIFGSGTGLTNLNYNNILNPPSIPNLNHPCTFFSTLFVSGTSILQNASTHLATVNISGATTLNSTLNIIGNIIGSGTALTNLNYNAISNPPTIPNLNNPCTFLSTLFVSGTSISQNASTHLSTLFVSGTSILQGNATYESTLTIGGTTFVGYNNSNPYVQLGNVNGNNYGVAATPGNFSTSAATGDTILRSINNLLLQSGASAAGLVVNTSNNTMIYNNLNASGTTTLNNTTTLNSSINLANNTWHNSVDGINRFYYTNNGTTYFHSGNVNGTGFNFRNYAQSDIVTIDDTGNLSVAGAINANGNSLVFANILSDYKISLWGPNSYGFGIQSSELKYTSGGYHNFYNGSTRVFTIDSSVWRPHRRPPGRRSGHGSSADEARRDAAERPYNAYAARGSADVRYEAVGSEERRFGSARL